MNTGVRHKLHEDPHHHRSAYLCISRVTVDLAANAVTNIWVSFRSVGHSASVRPRVEECLRLFGEPTTRSISPDPIIAYKEPPEHWRSRMVYEASKVNLIFYFEDGELFSLEMESRPGSFTGKK